MILTLCRLDTDLTYYIVGFKPNATKATAHHMLVYGCEEPGAAYTTIKISLFRDISVVKLIKVIFHRNIKMAHLKLIQNLSLS